jgi:hypothetical protein
MIRYTSLALAFLLTAYAVLSLATVIAQAAPNAGVP